MRFQTLLRLPTFLLVCNFFIANIYGSELRQRLPSPLAPNGQVFKPSSKLIMSHRGAPDNRRFIVVLHESASIQGLEAGLGETIRHHYDSVFNGFSAELNQEKLQFLLSDRRVKAIYQTSKLRLSESQSPVTWGLDRCDQASAVLDKSYGWRNDGQGVTAYIIDTGLFAAHPDFGGRAKALIDLTIEKGSQFENIDGHGHGTHVAGTIGSKTYGIAKAVNLIGIKVFDRRGSEATDETVLAGIDEAMKHHEAFQTLAVMNLSLGGEASEILDLGLKNAISSGITVVVAAGNESTDACDQSPARLPEAITVGAIGKGDRLAFFSNYGRCVDVLAPGVGITSLKPRDKGTATMDGTSMATPHATGISALILSANPQFAPSEVAELMIKTSIKDVAKMKAGTPNRIASTLWNHP